MTNRNIALVVVFSIISCGIYMFYWIYKTSEELEMEGQTGALAAPVILILSVFLSGIGMRKIRPTGDVQTTVLSARNVTSTRSASIRRQVALGNVADAGLFHATSIVLILWRTNVTNLLVLHLSAMAVKI